MNHDFYPAGPADVPPDLVKLTGAYQARVAYVLAGILFFILFYLAMVAGAAYLVYLAVIYPMGVISGLTILIKLGAIGITSMFFIFTLKFLFKKNSARNPTDVEIKEKDHPRLFQFIRQLCKETGAPFPKKVIVNEQINAAVFYDNPLLSMFLPVRKNLLIGLGLVNTLNLSEFKAVLAHEFGHFGQRSMKLGSYVYMANRIIHDMVYNRDRWDETLENWSRSDLRVAVFAWILKAFVWIVRQILALVYQGINLLHASLSRQMEFNADLVAVSTTGSDQIINGLSKLMRSSHAMNLAMEQLTDAADHQLYSSDLFFHQRTAEQYLLAKIPEYADRQPAYDEQGRPYIFTEADQGTPNMYASHPSNYDREQNAKRLYIRGVADERSPWILFGDVEGVRAAVTQKLYEHANVMAKEASFSPPEEVNAFIQAELAETSFDERYCGVYDKRFIHAFPLEEAEEKAREIFAGADAIQAAYAGLYGDELQTEMEKRRHLQSEIGQLMRAAQGGKKRSLEFRGETIAPDQLGEVFQSINQEIQEQYDGWFKAFDEKSFYLYLAMILEKNLPHKADYLHRCAFHNRIQQYYLAVDGAKGDFNNILQEMMAHGQMQPQDVLAYEQRLDVCRQTLGAVVEEAKEVELPVFEYMEGGKLKDYLLEGRVIMGGRNLINSTWLNKFSEQLNAVQSRARRIYFKSLGRIIKLQEEISAAYLGG